MNKTLQTYYQEQLKEVQQLIRKAKSFIAEDQVGKAINQLVQYDEYLSEALDLILDKRRLTKNERDRQNNTIFTKEYEVKASQIAAAVNSKVNELRTKLSTKNQDFPFKDFSLAADLSIVFGAAAPYKQLLAIQKLLKVGRCVVQVQVKHKGGLKIGAGLLVEGNFLVTNHGLIPNPETAQKTTVQVDFVDQNQQDVLSYSLAADTWIGDAPLNFAKIKVKEAVSSWHLYQAGSSTPKSGQHLLLINSGLAQDLQGKIQFNRLKQFTDPFLMSEPSEEAVLPGTPVFDKEGQIVGLHPGSSSEINRITTWSAIENYEEATKLEEEIPESPIEQTDSDTSPQPSAERFFGSHHKYTCDRVLHNDHFTPYIDVADQQEQERLHFFYLHGGERQEHLGLFSRFVARLKGQDKDHIKIAHDNGVKVEKVIINFPRSFRLENLKIELPLKVLLAFQMEEKQIEKIEHKCLADALKVENSLLYQLRNEDKICLLINVNESAWNPDLTPQAATWFIEDFCQQKLPESCPEFFIFFAINYDDEDEEEKAEMQAEVQAALNQGKYTKALFPVLDMVENRDIKAWFDEYAVFWQYDRKRIRQVRSRHFGTEKMPRYMEDVQDILEDIIEEVNQENT